MARSRVDGNSKEAWVAVSAQISTEGGYEQAATMRQLVDIVKKAPQFALGRLVVGRIDAHASDHVR